MHASLLDALSHLLAGRFIRARKSAEAALAQEASLTAGGAAAGQRRRSCARWRTCWPPRARRRCRTAPAREEHLQAGAGAGRRRATRRRRAKAR